MTKRFKSRFAPASAPPRLRVTTTGASKTAAWPLYQDFFLPNSFYLFVGWYGLQRFLWEFLKPYPPVIGPFNTFHLICAALVCYSLFMLRGKR